MTRTPEEIQADVASELEKMCTVITEETRGVETLSAIAGAASMLLSVFCDMNAQINDGSTDLGTALRSIDAVKSITLNRLIAMGWK
jgi:hypothetical protein